MAEYKFDENTLKIKRRKLVIAFAPTIFFYWMVLMLPFMMDKSGKMSAGWQRQP
jgi:hypothetical protein